MKNLGNFCSKQTTGLGEHIKNIQVNKWIKYTEQVCYNTYMEFPAQVNNSIQQKAGGNVGVAGPDLQTELTHGSPFFWIFKKLKDF